MGCLVDGPWRSVSGNWAHTIPEGSGCTRRERRATDYTIGHVWLTGMKLEGRGIGTDSREEVLGLDEL